MSASMLLHCVECGCDSDENARGWCTYLAPDPDEPDGEPMVATYCPVCAVREFGVVTG